MPHSDTPYQKKFGGLIPKKRENLSLVLKLHSGQERLIEKSESTLQKETNNPLL